jgi:mannose-1-phosphate guanylyltransferase
MRTRQRTWAIVLAAGDGTRLATLTTDEQGVAVPKQYCSLAGGGSLLAEAVERAQRIVPRERVCAIVARQHERWWRNALLTLPSRNVIPQPRNCGTANGILLALLSVLERDPLARIVFLPADHYVRDEATLAQALRAAVLRLTRRTDELLLVGIEPDEVDPELGYIVPGAPDGDGVRAVARFVEKPPAALARELIVRGAVWNSFIFAAHGPVLLGLLRARLPQLVGEMETALAADVRRGFGTLAIDELYERLPGIDFSREIIQGAEGSLAVLTARACGWSDLGTPKRVAETLRRLEPGRANGRRRASRVGGAAFMNLATQYSRVSLAG